MNLKELAKKILRKYPKLIRLIRNAKERAPVTFNACVSYGEAVVYTKSLAKNIPNEFDIILGIPRGGLFVADIIATKFGRSLSTPRLFLRGEIWSSRAVKSPEKIKKILIVDSTAGTGNTFKDTVNLLKSNRPDTEIKTACLFCNPQAKKYVDYVYSVKKPKGIFEWEIAHNTLPKSVDMDGVLCEDPPSFSREEDYINWMKNARPFLLPTHLIDSVITSRLEKYRKVTEEWLIKHGIKYKKLKMMNLPDESERNFKNVVEFKAKALKKSNSKLFWESDLKQAQEINKLCKIPVLCTDEMILIK